MSHQRNGTVRHGDEDEVCPVCKSSRYLNPDMRFLINPECYHKMCESCVDRIYSAGPAPCPVAGCHKTLRKNRFRKQTFEDIGVEREVDIRRRVMQILNRREEEFATKRAWDDFLEQREEIIANLVSGIDVAKTEADLQKYAAENMHSIKANQALESQESTSFMERQSFDQEQARLRRQAAMQEYQNERREMLAGRESMLSRLASGTAADAAAIAREGQKVLLKKSSARRSEEDRIRAKQAALRGMEGKKGAAAGQVTTADTAGADSGLIKGLKKITVPEPEKPYDPFGGLLPGKRDYYQLQDHYPSSYLEPIRKDVRMQAGGYDLKEYYSRTLLEAFAGLGCFIDEEVAKRDADSLAASKPIATEGAAAAAVSTGGVDVE
ncbi:TFIIH/NER complex subunit [Paecilomyces lecythidis]|uniref:RNA polymerase II transcription factor B subunit 3 n=1 Tax=Paecilomyces lecythidis TaxID=3004212 RepID=A0ABR3Y5K8_9EURO